MANSKEYWAAYYKKNRKRLNAANRARRNAHLAAHRKADRERKRVQRANTIRFCSTDGCKCKVVKSQRICVRCTKRQLGELRKLYVVLRRNSVLPKETERCMSPGCGKRLPKKKGTRGRPYLLCASCRTIRGNLCSRISWLEKKIERYSR